jgi:small subunit ribosomal protein S1
LILVSQGNCSSRNTKKAAKEDLSLQLLKLLAMSLTVTVARMTNFGAFIDLGGVDGLVHVSEIAYDHVDKPSDVSEDWSRG